VPGTLMIVYVPNPTDRHDIIAYLATLTNLSEVIPAATASALPQLDPRDWHNDAPGLQHRVEVASLVLPFSTKSAGNGPKVVKPPADAKLSVPPGFKAQLFAKDLHNPRLMRVAPNGDIFIAETGANRIRVLRAADGAESPTENEIFAEGLDRPFGIAFYPAN